MFQRIRTVRPVHSLAFGPGTPNLNDHGVRYISNLIKSISPDWRGGISVELVPPHNIDDLGLLVAHGVGSMIMSLEIWDDERRAVLCPGKSYISKSHYIDAWRYVVQALGRGKISSVLLVGLESVESTKAGIDALCEMGVVPTLIPFRPYDQTAVPILVKVRHEDYLEVSRHNIFAMEKHGISPNQQVGCTECGGCSLDNERSITPTALI